MPVVVKRDSLEAMGPVVGEELLEAAAEAAKNNAASILESAAAAGNSNSSPSSAAAAGAAARGGEVVEGVGESDFGMMTELRELDCPPTSAGLDSGLTGGWTVWSYDD